MIAMSLCCSPALLIADEPTTALDVTIQAQIFELLRELQAQENMSIMMITHDLGVVAENADDVVVMYASRVVETRHRRRFVRQAAASVYAGPAEVIAETGRKEKTPGCDWRYRSESAQFSGRVQVPYAMPDRLQGSKMPNTGTAPEKSHARSDRWPAGMRKGTEPIKRKKPHNLDKDLLLVNTMSDAADNLVTVRNLKTHFPIRAGVLNKTIGHVKAVDGVSFSIRAGRTLGLVGESGCGKTTVGRTMMRLIPRTEGTFIFDEQDVFSISDKEMKVMRRDIQMMFQDPYGSLNPRYDRFRYRR